MDGRSAEGGALCEAIVFLDYFNDLVDPRQQGKVLYPLREVLLLYLLAVSGGAETFAGIACFGEKLSLLRRFLPFRVTGAKVRAPSSGRIHGERLQF